MAEKTVFEIGTKGINWGRIEPDSWTPVHGDWVFCLGLDKKNTIFPYYHEATYDGGTEELPTSWTVDIPYGLNWRQTASITRH